MLAIIAACEIAFWAVLAIGLGLRYPLRRPRTGVALLATVPLIDVVLLGAVALHLQRGGTATTAHSVATFYLGFSLAYGHRMIGWADRRFAHRFAGGPAPGRLTGAAFTRQCWGDVRRTAAACLLAVGISAALIAWVDDPARTTELGTAYGWAVLVTGLETLAAISYTIWPRRADAPRPS